ncbi:MAG: hypothetical protein LUH07_00620 [Lachnospiraceae bacterium]|nr:hypothetical protein [Lachnospiraceae bacterium]
MKDVIFLLQKAEPHIAMDLLETLKAHEGECVGMAANMIGVNKAIIAVNIGFINLIFFSLFAKVRISRPLCQMHFGSFEAGKPG